MVKEREIFEKVRDIREHIDAAMQELCISEKMSDEACQYIYSRYLADYCEAEDKSMQWQRAVLAYIQKKHGEECYTEKIEKMVYMALRMKTCHSTDIAEAVEKATIRFRIAVLVDGMLKEEKNFHPDFQARERIINDVIIREDRSPERLELLARLAIDFAKGGDKRYLVKTDESGKMYFVTEEYIKLWKEIKKDAISVVEEVQPGNIFVGTCSEYPVRALVSLSHIGENEYEITVLDQNGDPYAYELDEYTKSDINEAISEWLHGDWLEISVWA